MIITNRDKFTMLRIIYTITIFLFISYSSFATNKEEILQAMRDEIQRSLNELQMEGLEKPYYVEYKLTIKNVNQLSSVLGNITSYDTAKTASLNVGLRVGDYKFDNTNFFDVGLSFFGSSDDEERFKNRRVSIEPDYKSLRRELWLATDAAYKQSAEIYSKKKSVLENRTRVDTTRDFLKIPVNKKYISKKHPDFDLNYYRDLCNQLSSEFKNYSQIYKSSVGIEFIPETVYYVNSEGIEYIKTEMMTGLEIVAFSIADDGMPIADFQTFYSNIPNELPTTDSLMATVKKIASSVVNQLNSQSVNEPYSGPILFTGQAAAELFAQIFAPNLVTQRDVITESGVQSDEQNKAFQMKIGGRVLPDYLSLEAKPNLEKYNEIPLLGNYQIDDSGLEPQDVLLVEDGYLKNLLSERIPTRRVHKSNGHKRDGGAMYSTLVLEPNDDVQKDYEQLKEKMIEFLKARELEYGYIIKKVMNKNLMFTTLFRLTNGKYQIPRGDGKIAPVETYRIYQDGREELVRGASGAGFSPRSFRDIVLTGNKPYVYNFLAQAVISPFVSGGSQFIGSTVIIPDLLFEDAEIRMQDGNFEKPPILPNPLQD
jgi:TldD protein